MGKHMLSAIMVYICTGVNSSVSTVFASDADKLTIPVYYITREEEPRIPLSLLDLPADQEGFLGAQLGINDNQTTGDFLGHEYELNDLVVSTDQSLTEAVVSLGIPEDSVFVADLLADDLLTLAETYPRSLLTGPVSGLEAMGRIGTGYRAT